jgi:hypothetical protein
MFISNLSSFTTLIKNMHPSISYPTFCFTFFLIKIKLQTSQFIKTFHLAKILSRAHCFAIFIVDWTFVLMFISAPDTAKGANSSEERIQWNVILWKQPFSSLKWLRLFSAFCKLSLSIVPYLSVISFVFVTSLVEKVHLTLWSGYG